MDSSPPEDIPGDIWERVKNEPNEFLERDARMEKKYEFGEEYESEPMKAIQKEKDGMARLLCAIVTEDGVNIPNSELMRIYRNETRRLVDLEEEVVDALPERPQDK